MNDMEFAESASGGTRSTSGGDDMNLIPPTVDFETIARAVWNGINTTEELAKFFGTDIEMLRLDSKRNPYIILPMHEFTERHPDRGKQVIVLSDRATQLGLNGTGFESFDENCFFEIIDGRPRFVPKLLADRVKHIYSIKSLEDKELLYYSTGLYIPGAENRIEEVCRFALGKLSNTNKVNEVIGHVSGERRMDRRLFDTELHKLNLKNCLLDIKAWETEPHTEHHLSTIRIPVRYDPEADCPKIKEFLSQVVDEQSTPVLQEMFGYCLYPDYIFHKMFMFLGEGRNGKSTMLNLLKHFLGEQNVSNIPLQKLEADRFAPGKLYGKLANIFNDLSDKALNETGIMKSLTGGDHITCDRKFKEPFEFVNRAKLIFSANRLPQSTYDDSDAFYSRWVLIMFPNTFEGREDVHLIEKMTTKGELSGLLNWALEGLRRLLEQGHFSNTLTSHETRKLYRTLSSPIASFIESELEEDPESVITKEEMYARFVLYCRANNLIPVSINKFGRDFPGVCGHDIIVKEYKTKNAKCWQGAKFRENNKKEAQKTLSD